MASMHRSLAVTFAALAAAGVICSAPLWAQSDQDDEELTIEPLEPAMANQQFPWPAQFSEDNQSFTVYPPELDRWEGDRLQGRAAVSVLSSGDAKPQYGVADITARVQVDPATQVATARDISITRISFPTAVQEAARYREVLQAHLAAVTWRLPADQLRGQVAVERTARASHRQPVRNDPPTVLFSDRPALLVPIDGPPVLKEMVGLGVKRVLNTRALILQDRDSDRYFLSVAGRWMESRTLDGPWSDAQIRPSALDEAKQQAQADGEVDLLDADNRAAAGPRRIFVTTRPTELVQTDGPPQYSPVAGTQLLYITNTPNRLFLDLNTQQYYVLLSGRWFRTQALDRGRWEYVAGAALPRDFAAIPANHPTATVREAVPGTPQAEEAAIANSVPQVATVTRSEALLDVTYDGPPQFKPIEGTPLEYAVNAAIPVIRVDDRDYYALDNGVWFFSSAADGPWAPASYVPPVIYSIPRSSPLHYVTYVRVYDATPDVVSVGYSPGYVGSYVNTDNTVVYGSGYYYRPWVGSMWYPCPVTWGFGFSYWNTWWNPWPWWRPWWAYRPVPYYRPWWGPWHRPVMVHQAVVVTPVVVGAPPVRPVVVNRANVPNMTNMTNITNIYQRWGRNVVTPHPATVMVGRAGLPVPGAPAGQRQQFSGNAPLQNSQPAMPPPAQAGRRDSARVVPLAPAPGAAAPQVITVPRHDRRFVSEPANTDVQTRMPQSIVGPTPGIQTAPRPGNARPIVGAPPGIQPSQPGTRTTTTPRSIVGPTPGIETAPDVNSSTAGAPDMRPRQGDRGRATTVVPAQPSITPGAVRQRFETRGNSSIPPRAVPVPAPVTPQVYSGSGMSGGPHLQRPGALAVPPTRGRETGSVRARGDGRSNYDGGHQIGRDGSIR